MFRRFKFEKDEGLDWIPMSVRRKLDLIGLKIHLTDWTALCAAERLVVGHFPVATAEEREVLADFLCERLTSITSVTPERVKPIAETGAGQPPELLAKLATEMHLAADFWQQLDGDERFALARFAKRGDSEKLREAIKEFVAKPTFSCAYE